MLKGGWEFVKSALREDGRYRPVELVCLPCMKIV